MLGKARTPSHDQPDTSRRQFLRRAGITAAVTAALAGTADVAGMSSAFAAAQRKNHSYGASSRRCCVSCTYTPFHCNGGKACPSGECCFHCYHNCGNYYSYACLAHSCNNFSNC
jgi:anaerobic selenocysteine-containing dehydrogenase